MLTIVGCGAISATVIYQCYKQQIPFEVLLRAQDIATTALPKKCLLFTDFNGSEHHIDLPLKTNDESPIELLLLAVKSYQVEAALSQVKQKFSLAKNAHIVLLHNGMGTVSSAHKIFPSAHVLLASTTYAAFSKEKFNIIQTGIGETVFGCLKNTAECPALLQGLINSWQQASWVTDIENRLWLKLFINSVINPLTAVNNIKNGELRSPRYSAHVEKLIDEIMQLSVCLKLPFNHSQLNSTVYQVIENTAENYSSMQQDVAHQRKTEIDFITGYLLQQAKQYNLVLPCHLSLYQQLKQVEKA
ncbi:ketopantoate reductase family protein [Catenovulum sediminis]|uniref:2-dehydropantoate 2-reductase n=1 Tax=Catenovulum sediminis TaxID=1740262 RepID=A0ABV1RJH1_9ALTE|nr:2-dehydropantoate 2-reductase [Catenovulum sediminis]